MRILLDTLVQILVMLRHLVAEISHFKFDDYRVINTGASDLNIFCAVYMTLLAINICWTHSTVNANMKYSRRKKSMKHSIKQQLLNAGDKMKKLSIAWYE